MNITTGTLVSLLFIILGVILIKLRNPIGKKAVTWYKKVGIEVPEDIYIKQFVFVGVMLMLIGFLGATGLLARF
ncbi:MAG: hypothetical protein PVJ39_01335 [Gammaproteobacteria bacterium]|jgi:hypothetical protein